MARQVDQQRREVWRKRIAQQGRGDVTVAEFCRAEGVSTASFFAWKRKLRGPGSLRAKAKKTAPAPMRRGKVAPTRHRGSAAAPGAAFVQLPLPAVPASPWIEVVLAEGTVVRVGQQNLAALQLVLRALKDTVSTPALGEVRHA